MLRKIIFVTVRPQPHGTSPLIQTRRSIFHTMARTMWRNLIRPIAWERTAISIAMTGSTPIPDAPLTAGPYIQDAIGCPDEAIAVGQTGSPEVVVLLSLGYNSTTYYTLTVTGTGQGTVTSGDGQIDCVNGSGVCSAIYTSGTTVTLNAAGASGWVFSGWSGPCGGSSPSCTLVMNGNSSAGATFLESQTITFGALGNVPFGTAPFAISANASSGLVVIFASTTPPVCTVSGAVATIVAAGTCSIKASQAGNGTYAAAVPVTQTFTVLALQTIRSDRSVM